MEGTQGGRNKRESLWGNVTVKETEIVWGSDEEDANMNLCPQAKRRRSRQESSKQESL